MAGAASFDVAGARAAGYSDAEIADHLAQGAKFNAAQARKAGYSDDEIIAHLTGTKVPPAPDVMAEHRARLARAEGELADATASPNLRKAAIAADTLAELPGAAGETALNLGSQAIAVPAAGIAGGVAAPFVGNDRATNIVNKLSSGLTYEPGTQIAKNAQQVIQKPAQWLSDKADNAGQAVTDATGSPLAGALVNGAIQTAPALLSPEVRGAFKGAAATAVDRVRAVAGKPNAAPTPRTGAPGAAPATVSPQAAAAAENYATGTLGLDWDRLSAAFKQKLAQVAGDATNLQGLDAEALKREGQLASLPVPVTTATRGQLSRSPGQMRREANLAATEDGAPIADAYAKSNQALLSNLDTLKGKVSGTGTSAATAINESDVGRSVQDKALAAKQALMKKATSDAYTAARNSPEAQMTVDPEPLRQFLQDPINAKDTSPVMSLLRGFVPEDGGGIKVADLERIRQKVNAGTQSPDGTVAHAAKQAVGVIDQMMEGAGGDLYAKARATHAAERAEFGDQGAVRNLVTDKAGTTDRRVALDKTVDTIVKGSPEDIENIKRSLLTGGDASTRTAGKAAWRDVRAQIIQQIKDDATSGPAMADGTPNVNPGALKRAIERIGPERLDAIFGPGTHRQLMDIQNATTTLKEMPALGGPPVGSTTVQNVLSFLSKAGDIPLVGDVAVGAVKAVKKLNDLGAAGREAKASTTTPLSEAVDKAAGKARNADRLKRAKGALPVVPLSQLYSNSNPQR